MKLFAQTSANTYTVKNVNLQDREAQVLIGGQAYAIKIQFNKGTYYFLASKEICAALGVTYSPKVAVKLGFDCAKLETLMCFHGNKHQLISQEQVDAALEAKKAALAAKKAAQKEAAKKRTPMGYSEQVLAGTYKE